MDHEGSDRRLIQLDWITRTFALCFLSVGHSESCWMTDEIGISPERLNEPMDIGMRSLHPAAADHSVSIRGSRCTALIILSLRSRAVMHHYCSSILRVRNSERVRALQRSSGGRGLTGEKSVSCEDSHTRSVRWPAPLRASALKIANSLKE